MEITILGYVCLTLMGLSLGLIGAGGSIMTIPILVYIFNIPIKVATTYSLIIVGITACLGMLRYRKKIFLRKL